MMSESIARRLALPSWLPTRPLSAWPNWEWVDSTGKRTDSKIWTVSVDLGPCSRTVRCTHPICIWRNRALGERRLGNQRIVTLVSIPRTTIIELQALTFRTKVKTAHPFCTHFCTHSAWLLLWAWQWELWWNEPITARTKGALSTQQRLNNPFWMQVKLIHRWVHP